MIPSGYKASKLYSVVPSDGSGDLSFSRSTTATRVNEDGLIESVAINTPRIDYKGGGCGSLLLEPQRTNLITYSEDFSNAYWTKSGSTVVSGQTSPSADSPTGAFKLVEDTSTGSHQTTQTLTGGYSIGDNITFSCYIKAGERSDIIIYSQQIGKGVNFDLATGTFGTDAFGNGLPSSYNAEVLENGWYRVSIGDVVATVVASSRIYLTEADDVNSYTGDGTSGVYVFGAQLELGSYPTSYIPTAGSTVTRTADSSSTSGLSSVINSEEGVFYAEMSVFSASGGNMYITLSDGSDDNEIVIRNTSATNNVVAQYVKNNSNQASMDFTLTDRTVLNSIAIRYKVNDFSLWINGVKEVEDTSGSVLSANTLNQLSFSRGNGTSQWSGKVKGLAIFNTYLTDTQMAELTTL